MSFTFNWAGIATPSIQGGSNNYQQTIREDAANIGRGLRGYEQRKANQEYADLLGKKRRVGEIQARISQLEARNAEIRKQLQGMAQSTAEPLPETDAPYTYYGQVGNMEYPLRDMNLKTPMNISGVPVSNAFGY